MDASLKLLAGKVVLITGGSKGIGKAIARLFAEEGANVIISGRKKNNLDEVVEELRKTGNSIRAFVAHSREPDDLRRLMENIRGEFGRLDILVNNAATNPIMANLLDTDEKAFQTIMDTNLRGYFLLSQMAAKLMIEQKRGGCILNISSIGGLHPMEGLGAYCISKAAINMLTKVLAMELGPHNIRVNALAPGIVQTRFSQALWDDPNIMSRELNRIPLQRIAQPQEIAQAALSLVSDANSYMTGQVIVLDGGATI